MMLYRVRVILFLLAVTCGAIPQTLRAQVSTTATIQVSCGSEPNSDRAPQVAVRWGSPSYDKNEYFKLWKVPCNGQPQNHPPVTLLNRQSELEVQTEGGVATHYTLQAKIKAVGSEGDSLLQIDHAGTPNVQINNPRISLTRSAGPNKYGEQNFRVMIPDGTAPRVKIQMASVNTSRSGQVALRWGHSDFNDTSDFKSPNPKIWKVKTVDNFGTQPLHELDFALKEKRSEFEIQTEGGTGTSYHIAMWFDFGLGTGMAPDIEITHGDTLPEVGSGGSVLFSPTAGNVYGELDVKIEDKKVVDPPTKPRTTPPAAVYLVNNGISFIGTFGSLGASGTITSITNGENETVVILSDKNLNTGCKGSGNVTLTAHSTTSAAQMQALYASATPKYPKVIGACLARLNDGSKQSLLVAVAYQPQ